MSSLLSKSVVQELRSWGPADYIPSNLEITAGILGTPDVVVIVWQSAVAIKPQLSSGSGGPDTACSSGNCWRSPARSDVPTSPCREAIRHQSPGAALGWLVRSSG